MIEEPSPFANHLLPVVCKRKRAAITNETTFCNGVGRTSGKAHRGSGGGGSGAAAGLRVLHQL
jgi:hypothetical protein